MDSFRDKLQGALGSAYALGQELSGGGMSRVFLAEDRALGRMVVVKVLPEESAATLSVQRFKREIALAARLHHPHIVPVLSAGEMAGIPFYTMPFVAGDSLREKLTRGPMPPNEVVRVLRAVASALSYAHQQHVVHRDIKPANVLLAGDVATVTDFGVAKAVRAAAAVESGATSTGLTSFGVALGTPAYMAPEQAAADPAVDHRADIYSLGCLAYEMLAGEPPFAGRTPQQMLAAHLSETPLSVASKAPTVPQSLAQLVTRCLAKSPDDRPQTAGAVIHMLDEVTTASGGPSAAAESIPATRRSRSVVLVAAALVLIVIGFVVVTNVVGGRTETRSRSVGILPFANLSGDKENEYFSDGMTQEITNALAKVPGLRVASETPGSASRASISDVRAIGKALGVETVLLGSVQRSGDRVRINARLVSVADGFQLWSDKYDREVANVFALQDEIARAIVGGLRLQLSGVDSSPLVRAATADPEAYNLFLQGWYFWNRRGIAELRESIALFERAIARDPTYARAYGALSMAYAVLIDYDHTVDARQLVDSALIAGNRALAIDRSVVEAHTGIANAHAHVYRNAEAIASFRRAIAADSNFAPARQWYAQVLAHVGQFDEALPQIRRARDLEPLSLIINSNVGRIALEARRYDEAKAALRHSIDLDSTRTTAHILLGSAYLAERKHDSAIVEISRALELEGGRRTGVLSLLGYAYAVAGRRAEAEAIRAEILERAARAPVLYSGLAMLHHALGDTARAIAALDTAVQRYDSWITMSSREERYDALRRHPRGAELLASTEAPR